MSKWLFDDKDFIKENWPHMNAKELANSLGRTKTAVKNKIEDMIKAGELLKKDELKSQIYGQVNLESGFELNARAKTEELQKIQDKFKLEDIIKIKFIGDLGRPKGKILEGKIIEKTDKLIVVKSKNYKESFKYIDFYTKRVIVI